MKTLVKFKIPGTKLADSNNAAELKIFAEKMGYGHIDPVEVMVPVLETGDAVVISKCFGHIENDDGISSGGRWSDVTGIYTALND